MARKIILAAVIAFAGVVSFTVGIHASQAPAPSAASSMGCWPPHVCDPMTGRCC
jgi:hypothetical protein